MVYRSELCSEKRHVLHVLQANDTLLSLKCVPAYDARKYHVESAQYFRIATTSPHCNLRFGYKFAVNKAHPQGMAVHNASKANSTLSSSYNALRARKLGTNT